MKNYKDSELKCQVLRVLMEHGDLSSAEINEYVRYRGDKHSYYGYIYQLARRGFISKTNAKKPYVYKITKQGREYDPFTQRKRKAESLQHRVSQILNSDERFAEALEVELSKRVGGHSVSGSGVISAPTASVNDSKVIEEMRKKDDRIAQLETMIMNMKRSQPTGPQRTGPGQPAQQSPDPEKAKSEARRVKNRKQLAQVYYSKGVFLDGRFFSLWGEVAPHKIKFKRYVSSDGTVTPDSIEIMSSKSNKEISRGHAHKKPIGEALLRRCMFHIVNIDDRGIDIRGHGLPGNKARLRF